VRLLLTCEHGGNRVPRGEAALFAGRSALLRSHLGYDPGALAVARSLARRLQAPLLAATTTRLLVDANRSPGNPRVFSSLTRGLPPPERERLLARHHRPHWRAVRRALGRLLAGGGPVLHVAVHSFAPVLRGRPRRTDLGLLYDPARPAERALCARWRALLRRADPTLRVRRNYPYRGRSDGLTTALRRHTPARQYRGIEIEISQRLATSSLARRRLVAILDETLRELLEDDAGGSLSRRAAPLPRRPRSTPPLRRTRGRAGSGAAPRRPRAGPRGS
jgi:predicted N-formylglutamate amidohydrolase